MGVKIFIKKPLKLTDVQNCKEYLSNNNNYEKIVGFENNNFKDKYLD